MTSRDLHERVAAEVGEGAAHVVTRFVDETMNRAARELADGTIFLVTGDIPAMWLRDSAAQVLPLLRLGEYCPHAADFVAGVLRRQLSCIVLDPYANAFNARPDGAGHQRDKTHMSLYVWERKYEIDSLCYPLLLAERLWHASGRTDHFDELYWRAVARIVELWEVEQNHETRSAYRFRRRFARSSGTLARRGLGSPVAVTGMTWSGFRPSDDACVYGYNVPGNMFAARVLGGLPSIAETAPAPDSTLIERATRLRAAIENGLREHAIVTDPVTGPRWAYEVDGLGGVLEIDDANVPSLLSLPRLDCCCIDDPMYQATRAFILSPRNPYYYSGGAAAGIGSPHTPKRHVWPIALAMTALTEADDAGNSAKRAAVALLLETRGGTDRIHESFHVDRPTRWTRSWFSWAEAMFCDLVFDCCGLA